jgi:hypothetical protein
MDKPTINQEIVTRPAEHEVFLSFVNDEDAVMFCEWLEECGFSEFEKWAEDESQ